MASEIYIAKRKEILEELNARRIIQSFRVLIYQVDKPTRATWFDITSRFIVNEMGNASLSEEDKRILEECKNHFTWQSFEANSTMWWNGINTIHFRCKQLIEIMAMWLETHTGIDFGGESTSVVEGDSHSVGASTAGLY